MRWGWQSRCSSAYQGGAMSKHKLWIVAGILILLIVFGCYGMMRLLTFDEDRQPTDYALGRPARNFLEAIGERNEAKAYSYLSTQTQQAVDLHCPDGQVTRCFEELGLRNRISLRSVSFVHGEFSDDMRQLYQG